jgi:prepilin-type N-terminal cleavage/methylation domain-containing protein
MTTDGRQKKHILLDNSGFTLLEIIAVLVILAILAVVAVPRYFDLQTDAQKNAIEMALAEAIGRVNGYFAKQLLAGDKPEDIVYSLENLSTDPAKPGDMGDFLFSVTESGDDLIIGVSGKTGTRTEKWDFSTATKTISRPGSP